MKLTYLLAIALLAIVIQLVTASPAYGQEPAGNERPNNKFGIHILFPDELEEAARLVNSNGGDWGYVTIPIQAGDRDLLKWQKFMNKAKKLHIIPLVRLATEGDYFNTKVWRRPTASDVLDFANFLSSLDWPTKQRYVIVFNEVNRGDEWGGLPNPAEYADILAYAATAFKNKSSDFFILSSGLDNAAATTTTAINQYEFIRGMQTVVPDIFNTIDGLSSHSYPNPGFSQPPENHGLQSIASFRFEQNLVQSLSGRLLPVFITETGWSKNAISDLTIGEYYKIAFSSVWNDPTVVAVTPFLFRAYAGPFTQFSFINTDHSFSYQYNAFVEIPKVRGEPERTPDILGERTAANNSPGEIKHFSEAPVSEDDKIIVSPPLKGLMKWLLRV